MKLLLATKNPKKLRELQELVGPLGVEVVSPADCGGIPDVVEDGSTFEENAAKKATSGARATGTWCIGDDSGLEVDALDGAPGLYSARFAGPEQDDGANNAKLLAELDATPDAARGAQFVCVLALAAPDGSIAATFRGEARGRIVREARGDGRFGYDPLFEFTEPGTPVTGRTFAELTTDQKASVSHRGRALATLARELPRLVS